MYKKEIVSQGYDKGKSGETKLITFAQVKDSGELVPIKIEDC